MQNYYFDAGHPLQPYTHSAPANPGTFAPAHAVRTAPTVKKGFWPCMKNGTWEQVEDHRGKQGYVNGEAFTVKEPGPLPEGWSDTPPPPTLEEAVKKRKGEIQAELDALDRASIRSLRAIMKGAGTDFDTKKLAELDAQAKGLREELKGP